MGDHRTPRCLGCGYLTRRCKCEQRPVAVIRCKRCRAGLPCANEHGGLTRYTSCACRCGECRAARREYSRTIRRQRPEVREREREIQRAYGSRPGVKERKREYNQQYNKENRETIAAAARERRKKRLACPGERERINAEARSWRREAMKSPEFRERAQERDRQRRQRTEVKDAEREQARRYRSENPEYVDSRNRRYAEARLSIPAPRKGSPWTAAELAIVARGDLTVTEQCYMLGRTYQSVILQRKKLRLAQRGGRNALNNAT